MQPLLRTTVLLTVLLFPLHAADFALMVDGKAAATIVCSPTAPLPVQYAARELAVFLAKIADGEQPTVSAAPSRDLGNVFLGTVADQALTKAAAVAPSDLKPGGFVITTRPDGLYILGGDPLGALYGAYDILKKYGGIRWLFPGAEGEYFQVKKTIAVPEQKTIRNPYLTYRWMELNSVAVNKPYFDTREWQTRNYMIPKCRPTHIRSQQHGNHMRELGAECVPIGGHVLTPLLFGGKFPRQAEVESLFQEHPEYFPLVNGKRILLDGQKYQPCTSHPEVIEIMAKSLIAKATEPDCNGLIIIGNNDGTGWCECENCRRLDPPEEAAKNRVATRYWTLVQTLAQRVWEVKPDAKLGGWAYQNFWAPPTGITLDPRLIVCISFNNQCWRHAITDPKCSVNREFRKLYLEWKNLGVQMYNRDEIAASGSVGSNFLPAEKILHQNFLDYPSLGLSGSSFCIVPPPPDAEVYAPLRRNIMDERNLRWAAMWQTNYLSAQFMFDITLDFDALYEECNRLFYGLGWEGGMKEFRALLTKAFVETPGCMGWGQNAPLGRCLDQPGVQEQLKALLAKAEKAAAADPDPRALQHVQRERDIFACTWEAARMTYLESYRELTAFRKTAPIAIDGVIDEKDWKDADVMTGFMIPPWSKKEYKPEQTFFRVVYEPDNVYIAIEAMEPTPDAIIAEKNPQDAPHSKIGNSLEIFLSYPDMAVEYFHYTINSAGSIIDARHGPNKRDLAYNGDVEFATKVLADRWVLEMRIPTAGIGMKCFDGSTWRLNIARNRRISQDSSELSSWGSGHFHGIDNFGVVKFTPVRPAGLAQGHDPSAWKNASFNEVVENATLNQYRQWPATWKTTLVPTAWKVEPDTIGSTLLHPESSSNYYIELEKGIIGNWFVSPAAKLRITFRASGQGKARLWTGKYEAAAPNAKGYPFKGTTGSLTFEVKDDAWQTFTLDADKGDEPRLLVRFFHQEGSVRIDDVMVTPIAE
ncbi:MAG: DUF4838 domain-containing protein [Lentisphaeria bacterium]|jgi:hypothetical protein